LPSIVAIVGSSLIQVIVDKSVPVLPVNSTVFPFSSVILFTGIVESAFPKTL
jgi:hypothetical protein